MKDYANEVVVSGGVIKNDKWWQAVELKAHLDLDAAKRVQQINLSKVDFEVEVDHWLNLLTSEKTRTSYRHFLGFFIKWCNKNDVDPRFIDRGQAERFGLWVKDTCQRKGYQNSWFDLVIKAVRSLYSHLQENVGEGLLFHNHFKGLKIKMPPKQPSKKRVATKLEVETLIRETDQKTSLAISIMAACGLRIGAMTSLELVNNGDGTFDYYTISKGKAIQGPVPTRFAIDLVKTIRSGFSGGGFKCEVQKGKKHFSGGKVFDTFTDYDIERTKKEILRVKNKHSFDFGSLCHSLRYYAAISLYNETKDIVAVKDLLNHSNVETTTGYLNRAGSLRKLDRYQPRT